MKKSNSLRGIVISSLLIISCLQGITQNLPENPYVTKSDPDLIPDYSVNKADLLSDIEMYIDNIDQVHPDPYRLISKESFTSEINRVKVDIETLGHEDINVIDCYYYLQKIAALIQDGHTKIYKPTNWSKLVSSFFPLNIKIIEGRMFVNKNFGDNEIPLKAEIISIDNKPVEEIISEMLIYCEGTFHEFKLFRVEEEFRYIMHTLYKSEAPWKIEYTFDGTNRTNSIEGISQEQLEEKNKRNVWFNESSIKLNNEELPVLNLPHLGFRKKDFKPFMDDFFDKHIDKKNIVINLRGCPGGNGSRVTDIVDHLTDSGYVRAKKFSHKASQILKDYVKYYIQDYLYYSEKKPIDEWKELLYSDSGVYQDDYDEIYREILDAELNTFTQTESKYHTPDEQVSKFKGNVFLMVDQSSFSAAVVFTSVFKYYKLATIVGRETGGRIDFFSDPVNIELTKTKLIAQIPTALLTLQGDHPHQGIIPDKIVDLTVDDYLNGIDPDIEAIKNMIK